MEQVYISFKEEPEGLERIFFSIIADGINLKKIANFTWAEKTENEDTNGVRVDIYSLIRKIDPEFSYTIRVSTESNDTIAQEKVKKLAKILRERYSNIYLAEK